MEESEDIDVPTPLSENPRVAWMNGYMQALGQVRMYHRPTMIYHDFRCEEIKWLGNIGDSLAARCREKGFEPEALTYESITPQRLRTLLTTWVTGEYYSPQDARKLETKWQKQWLNQKRSDPQNTVFKVNLGQVFWGGIADILFRTLTPKYEAWVLRSHEPITLYYETMADGFFEVLVSDGNQAYLLFWGEND